MIQASSARAFSPTAANLNETLDIASKVYCSLTAVGLLNQRRFLLNIFQATFIHCIFVAHFL